MPEFIGRLVSFGGRLDRVGFLGHALVAGGLFVIASVMGDSGNDNLFTALLRVAALFIYAAAATKRLRDAGHAGGALAFWAVLSVLLSVFSWFLLLLQGSDSASSAGGWRSAHQTGPTPGGGWNAEQAGPARGKRPTARGHKRALNDVMELARQVCDARAKGQKKTPAEIRLVYDWLEAVCVDDGLRRDAIDRFLRSGHARTDVVTLCLGLRANPAVSDTFLDDAFAMLSALVAANEQVNPAQRDRLAQIADCLEVESELSPAIVAIVALAAKIAKADGVVSRREIALLDAFFTDGLALSAEMRRRAVKVFRGARDDSASFRVYAERCAAALAAPEERKLAFQLFLGIASADGKVTAAEAEILDHVAAVFGIAYRSDDRQGEAPSDGQKGEAFYAEVLGVAQNADAAAIKAARREKIRQNHPDQIAGMSEAIRRVAEEEMKKINEAYDFFKARGRV